VKTIAVIIIIIIVVVVIIIIIVVIVVFVVIVFVIQFRLCTRRGAGWFYLWSASVSDLHASFDLLGGPFVGDTVMRPGHVLQPVGGRGGGTIGVVVSPVAVVVLGMLGAPGVVVVPGGLDGFLVRGGHAPGE
jgi:hypothetical protein